MQSHTIKKIRKNASRQIQSLFIKVGFETKFYLKTYDTDVSGAFNSNGEIEIDADQFDAWFKSNYDHMNIKASFDGDVCVSANFKGQYHFSDSVSLRYVLTQSADKDVIPSEFKEKFAVELVEILTSDSAIISEHKNNIKDDTLTITEYDKLTSRVSLTLKGTDILHTTICRVTLLNDETYLYCHYVCAENSCLNDDWIKHIFKTQGKIRTRHVTGRVSSNRETKVTQKRMLVLVN